jgi:hypothetical protein
MSIYSIGQIILAEDYNDILSKIETKKIYQSKKFDKPVHNLKSMIFQYPFPLLPLKSFSFKDILLWLVNFNTIGLMSLE